jgi:hypothetical protein
VLLLAAGCVIAGMPVESALVPVLVPVIGLLVLSTGMLVSRARGLTQEEARRSVVGALLVAVVLLFAAYWIVRDRYRVRPREAFDRAVAQSIVPGVDVWTLAPVEPGDVFHAAPRAHFACGPADLPAADEAARLLVLAPRARRAEVETRRGASARVLLEQVITERDEPVLLLSFGPVSAE